MMADTIPNELAGRERVDIARRYAESAESWLRMLVHNELSKNGNINYITSGEWKKSLSDFVANKYAQGSGRYTREIDATTFDQLVDMVCHPAYWERWSSALGGSYPHGKEEARTFLTRIQAVRNDVSHGQGCTSRQLEQVVCYTNDLADSIREHFQGIGMSKDFNVPTIIKCLDNVGNADHPAPGHYYRLCDFSGRNCRSLRPGDTLIVEIEVDPSFADTSYDVSWWVKTAHDGHHSGCKATILIENRHVAERMEVQFRIKTNLAWHRANDADDILDVYYKVLPPTA